jgi:glycosyltransferase involved in cell wall biosynthesis
MEAMAAGCKVISTELGALPETCVHLGELMDLQPDITPLVAGRFAAHAVNAICSGNYDVSRQVAYVRENYTWENRAQEWEKYLDGIK